ECAERARWPLPAEGSRREARALRRSTRIAAVTKLLVDRPYQTITLTHLSEWLGAAKSTLSEDIAIIRETFAKLHLGRIETIAGAAGGIRYAPFLSGPQMRDLVN